MAWGQWKWWRIRWQATQAAVSPRLARIQFKNLPGGVDWTLAGFGVSDSGTGDTNSNNGVDTSTATNWVSVQSAPTSWMGGQIAGGPAQIQEIVLTATNDVNFGGAPSSFWVEGSNDLLTWDTTAVCTAATWTTGSSQTFNLVAATATDTVAVTRVAAEVAYNTIPVTRLSQVSAEVLAKPTGVQTRLSAVNAQVLVANINEPTTGGVLQTVATTLLAGTGTGVSVATSIATDSITYGGDPVVYNGDPVIIGMAGTATASLIPGYATAPGYVTAGGSTLVATVSLIPGTGASSNVSATANGATLVTTCSLIAGSASALASGANGTTLVATQSLIPGTATGEWDLGQTLVVNGSVLAGNGSGTANASGDIITEAFTLIPGGETGTASVGGDLVAMGYSLIPGEAAGEQNATAPGVRLIEQCTLLAGLVTTTANVQGQMLVETETFIPGGAVINSTARGNILPFTPSILRGSVTVDTEVLGKVIHVDFSLPENTLGVVTGGANTPADVVPFSYLVELEGAATGTAVAQGAVVSFAASVLNGAVSADANIDAGTIFNVSVTLEPGVGFWFIGAPGDVMVDPHTDTRMELLAELRTFTVSVETRAIIVPHEERAMALSPRLKKVI